MTLWEILGFGTNNKRIEKWNQKEIEHQNVLIEILVRNLNGKGIKWVLKKSKETDNDEFKIDFIKAVLKNLKKNPRLKVMVEKKIGLKLNNGFMNKNTQKLYKIKKKLIIWKIKLSN